MKKNIIIPTIMLLSVASLQSCYHRIGKLVVVSTRNMDSKTDYILLEKDVTGKAKTKNQEALEGAIDKAVKKHPTGEFMKNVIIEVNASGKKIRVKGDVWGTVPIGKNSEKVDKSVTKTVNAVVEFKIGDKVTYKNAMGKLIEGTIVGTNQSTAVVEFDDKSKKEITYEKLTKIER